MTSVGGTNYIPETAVFFSGGGFSNYVRSSHNCFNRYIDRFRLQFPRPNYQNAAVREYLQTLTPGTYEGLYNP